MKVEGWLFLGAGIFFAGTDVVYWYSSKEVTGTTALALEQGTGEIGFFSPHSWWPLFMGLAAATAALGFAIGWWLFLIGMLFTVLATIGFVFEYYRGHFSH